MTLRYITASFLITFSILIFVSAVHAQAVNPFEEKPKCGFAGLSGDSAICCGVVDASGQVNQALNENSEFSGVGIAQRLLGSGGNSMNTLNQMQNKQCYTGNPTNATDAAGNAVCKCELQVTPVTTNELVQTCNRFIVGEKNRAERERCRECVERVGGIWTGIGCVPANLSNFITNFVLQIGIGFAGVIAMMCLIYSAFRLQTSAGNPEKIKAAQEQMTSCIVGLILIIFSVFILRVIGVDILRIPGFSA